MKNGLPTPRKLPSGKWFIQVRVNGRSKSFTHENKNICLSMAMDYKATMAIGGWSNDQTVQKIYTHLANKDMAMATEKMRDFFGTEKDPGHG